jgi:hypothetical protein
VILIVIQHRQEPRDSTNTACIEIMKVVVNNEWVRMGNRNAFPIPENCLERLRKNKKVLNSNWRDASHSKYFCPRRSVAESLW